MLTAKVPWKEKMFPKKVLLCERKRHTARRVASARYAALTPDWGGGGVPHLFLGRGGTI